MILKKEREFAIYYFDKKITGKDKINSEGTVIAKYIDDVLTNLEENIRDYRSVLVTERIFEFDDIEPDNPYLTEIQIILVEDNKLVYPKDKELLEYIDIITKTKP